ncbi:hypothetical protein [Burkholderia pseudomultivorans]|uniref:Uncharacterized protein n=1 Tax=Burkholderia pseudomultivorans TaxID=1207504 RepID=A0ABU2E6G2_9BURK|nr:hypothetical protein [Burkholderia pseudomultivorans]MDR8728013.1 hypothetical protein [Burkholderia pseudomultivorans]MDR8734124.1 hypothetical protein [Burkholderia pseudomultivorans]MDR8743650.1 hypothetical protein [Burkholderia pseudomultivorans]MDR8755432.1 hypothetical protein [Burkholderia pseudomultivorans]MDR8779686.1 hypothetical protein [Burkholderia pseudomultivorans]
MHREFSAIESSLEAFIDQPDDPTLLLEATDNDIVPVLKMLQSLDERVGDAIFLIFPFPCDSADAYLKTCMEALARQIADESAVRVERGEGSWPPLPLTCTDPRRAPAQRLRDAVVHVRTLIPEGVKVVWAWLPSPMGDFGGFAKIVLQCLALNGFEDWMEGNRFCIRDDRKQPCLIPLAREKKAEHVLILPVDFSSEKATRNLVAIANDAVYPIEQRMGALMQIAGIDLAHDRLPDAQRKYYALFAFHAERKDSTGCAIALHGLGDVALRHGSSGDAKDWYLRALSAALDGRNLLVVLNALMATGGCWNTLGEHAKAATYFDLASGAAGRMMLVHTKIEAMEKGGIALLACGQAAEAAKNWIAAKGLCEQFGCERQRISILDRLVSLYGNAGLKTEARAYELEKDPLYMARLRAATASAARHVTTEDEQVRQ